jgi:hypothetical protein
MNKNKFQVKICKRTELILVSLGLSEYECHSRGWDVGTSRFPRDRRPILVETSTIRCPFQEHEQIVKNCPPWVQCIICYYQHDHAWIIWILFKFTMGCHTLGWWNHNPKPCSFLLYMVGWGVFGLLKDNLFVMAGIDPLPFEHRSLKFCQ